MQWKKTLKVFEIWICKTISKYTDFYKFVEPYIVYWEKKENNDQNGQLKLVFSLTKSMD